MNFGIHPVVLIAAIALLALIAVVVCCVARSAGVRVLMMFLALVFLLPAAYVFCPELVDGRYRTYKAFYGDIQIGMTRDEVFAALDRRYPKSGARQRPEVMDDTADSLGFFMNTEISGQRDCEGIFLKLENGRVNGKKYSPD